MDIYRIEAKWFDGESDCGTIELVAGLGPQQFIAVGNWFGVVDQGNEKHPFVLLGNGLFQYAQYAGGPVERRLSTIDKKRVIVGETFALSWLTHEDVHSFRITRISRLNTNPDSPDVEPELAPATANANDEAMELVADIEPSIFIKNDFIYFAERPEALKANLAALIEAGHAIAVGQNSIEQVFTNVAAFKTWFIEQREPD